MKKFANELFVVNFSSVCDIVRCLRFINLKLVSMAQQPLVSHDLLVIEASLSDTVKHTTVGRTPLEY